MQKLALAVLLLAPIPSLAADTPAAEFTRTKRLAAKVTLSAKDKTLKAVLDELCESIEQQKLGRLRYEIAPPAVALVPPMVNLEAKDEPLAGVLARLLAPAGLKAIVISSEIDPKDGWLRIVPGEKMDVTAGPKASPEDEKDATLKLDAAKASIADKKTDDAKFLLNYVLKKYPTTAAAAEAKKLLESLSP